MANKKKTPKTPYIHLTHEERKHIAYLRNVCGKSGRTIAKEMNRSPTTICEEVQAGTVNEIYDPDVGQKKARYNRKRSKTKLLKVLLDGGLRKEIEKAIRKNISPRRISGTLKERGVHVSDKAIYKFVHEYSLDSYLCFRGKPKKVHLEYIYRKAKELDKVRVEQRPCIKGLYGHYEMDFIVSGHSAYVLLVVVEIHSHRVLCTEISK